MTLNDLERPKRTLVQKRCVHCTKLNEDRPIHAATKMWADDSSFWKYKVYADTRGSSSWRGPQMRVGLLTTAIFWRFEWLLLRKLHRDKASNIIWRQATQAIPCCPVSDCKMNDLGWPWAAISCKTRLLFALGFLYLEGLILKNNYVKTNECRSILSTAEI